MFSIFGIRTNTLHIGYIDFIDCFFGVTLTELLHCPFRYQSAASMKILKLSVFGKNAKNKLRRGTLLALLSASSHKQTDL